MGGGVNAYGQPDRKIFVFFTTSLRLEFNHFILLFVNCHTDFCRSYLCRQGKTSVTSPAILLRQTCVLLRGGKRKWMEVNATLNSPDGIYRHEKAFIYKGGAVYP